MNSFLDTLKQLGPARLGLLGGILIALMLFFVFVSTNLSSPSMKLLYSDLSTEDSSAVAAKLEESQIKYQISADGARVMVPGDAVGKARMLLAAAGLPNGGSMGYEIFDKQSSFGTTNFVQNINQVRALEGELSRTISSLQPIKSARVHLVLPQRELFSRETRPSTASVFLGIRPGATVDKTQIAAIQSLVASAVPDLKMGNVSVIDSNGNLLAKGGEEGSNAMTEKAEDMRRSYEDNLTQKIEDQVSRVVGYGKVRASVTAEVNFDQINTAEELYDPNGQVARSTSTNSEDSTDKESSGGGSDVSVQNNLPGVGGDLLSDQAPTSQSNKTEEVTNYEISKTVRNTVREAGEIKRLSVSVLVDGKYNKDKDGKETYEARSADELKQIRALISSAVGFDEKRGDTIEVVNLPFAQVDTTADANDTSMLMGFQKSDLIDMAELLTIAVMVILVVLLVLQPMVSRLMSFEGAPKMDPLMGGSDNLLASRPMNPALAAPTGSSYEQANAAEREEFSIDLQGVEGKVKTSSLKKVEEIVDNYPAETVSVIRSWMTQEA